MYQNKYHMYYFKLLFKMGMLCLCITGFGIMYCTTKSNTVQACTDFAVLFSTRFLRNQNNDLRFGCHGNFCLYCHENFSLEVNHYQGSVMLQW